jgi:hypothetical protein
MKVRELNSILQTLDPELDLYCFYDGDFSSGRAVVSEVFEVTGVTSTQAVTGRDENRKPFLTFGGGDDSRELGIIEITPDF